MKRQRHERETTSRRHVLRALGTGAVGLAVGPTLVGVAAGQEFPAGDRTHWGRPTAIGEGVMATFASTGRGGRIRRVGVWFTGAALDGLPGAGDERTLDDGEEGVTHEREDSAPSEVHATDLAMPAVVAEAETPFSFAGVDWNPRGHPPLEVYGLPHFDFHFYFVDRATLNAEIPAGECDADGDGTAELPVPCEVNERGLMSLPADQLPPGYVSTEEVVPNMGNHWVNEDAAELGGERFTHTFIWGAFDGRLTFMEPMVTREFFRGMEPGRANAVVRQIPMPRALPRAGRYPTEYVLRRTSDPDAYAVYLRAFERFPAAR